MAKKTQKLRKEPKGVKLTRPQQTALDDIKMTLDELENLVDRLDDSDSMLRRQVKVATKLGLKLPFKSINVGNGSSVVTDVMSAVEELEESDDLFYQQQRAKR